MHSRRQFIVSGFAALSAGLLARRAGAGMLMFAPPPAPRNGCLDTGALPLGYTNPFLSVPRHPQSVMINGLPFAQGWFGDDFPNLSIPFHSAENQYPNGQRPVPTEEVDIAIVGGGLSGLATAYQLRHRKPVLFELHDRLGGTSMGEEWGGVPYSLGGAYFITPDPGTPLNHLYHQLGIIPEHVESPSTDDPTERDGHIVDGFWEGAGLNEQEREAFAQYRAMVQTYVDRYPEIPLIPDEDNQWIRDLDSITLKNHIESTLTVPVPTILETAINAYCYSSFNAGWETISAACGWNFIAAEEFGRWVLPGGNVGLIKALWERLLPLEAHTPANCPPRYLRCGSRVVEVDVLGPNRVLVVYKGSDLRFRALIAKRVIMACPKHVTKYILTKLRAEDPERLNLFSRINTSAYVVANVLLNKKVDTHFYDLFMLRNGVFETPFDVTHPLRVTDAVKGSFALPDHGHGHNQRQTDVLTCYWPLSFGAGRFAAIADDAHELFATRIAPELDAMLGILNVRRQDIEQIRLTRWGHAMPIALPGLITDHVSEMLRQPWREHVFFVHSDNWSLPAVETCLQEAIEWAPKIEKGL